jgi:hypothetical protein
MRVLLTGWFSFLHGEATAGDILALESVCAALASARIGYEIAWSPVFRPAGLRLEDAAPDRYTHLIFVCGPVRGEQVAALHARYASCRRIAVGVTVIDRADPEYAGFDLVLARDGDDRSPPLRDLAAVLAAFPAERPVPVTGIVLASGQGEYGERRRHGRVAEQLTRWIGSKNCAPVPLETRLDIRDWRLCSTAEAFMALTARLDVVITSRLHGLVLALHAGVPALAVDPVAGGGKVTAQASAWQWPSILAAEDTAEPRLLDAQWDWCLSAAGRAAAAAASRSAGRDPSPLLTAMLAEFGRVGGAADRANPVTSNRGAGRRRTGGTSC